MSSDSNVQILDVPYRSYDSSRDWLTPTPRQQPGTTVVPFTARLERCSICMSAAHRASRCPHRPGQQNQD